MSFTDVCPHCSCPLAKRVGRYLVRCLGLGCGLEYSVTPRRPTPMRRSNPDRRKKMHERNYGEQARVIREELVCLVKDRAFGKDRCCGRIEAAHVTPRGMGGCNSSAALQVPLCRKHHQEQEGRSAAFEDKYKLKLIDEAERVAELVRRRLEALP